jgi:hypothetical protein
MHNTENSHKIEVASMYVLKAVTMKGAIIGDTKLCNL